VDLVLTAGGASTDPEDPFFVALHALGGRVVRQGVPAHPGSMLWLGRAGRTALVGLPTCGAYSRATAADLLIPRLLAGEPPTAATVAKLGHGGVLSREMRFRFPAYALELEAPEG
jgi:molybdopterin biosynthesis enzyme